MPAAPREIGPEDVPLAVAVLHAAFAEYTSRGAPSGAMLETVSSVREALASGVRIAIVERDGEPVASVRIAVGEDRIPHFSRLAVVPDARGAGLARALVDWARDRAREMGAPELGCVVRAAEQGNIDLYTHLGARVVSRSGHSDLTGAVLDVVEMRQEL